MRRRWKTRRKSRIWISFKLWRIDLALLMWCASSANVLMWCRQGMGVPSDLSSSAPPLSATLYHFQPHCPAVVPSTLYHLRTDLEQISKPSTGPASEFALTSAEMGKSMDYRDALLPCREHHLTIRACMPQLQPHFQQQRVVMSASPRSRSQ